MQTFQYVTSIGKVGYLGLFRLCDGHYSPTTWFSKAILLSSPTWKYFYIQNKLWKGSDKVLHKKFASRAYIREKDQTTRVAVFTRYYTSLNYTKLMFD